MKQRPPKPTDRPANPRVKVKSKKTDGDRRHVLDSLAQLTRSKPGVADYIGYWQEVAPPDNARGAAVLIAANVENALDLALIRNLHIDEIREKDLFGAHAPLSTFDNKVRMAHALGIIGNETRANLDVIRVIRNTFAHAKVPLTFQHRDILKACALLTIPAHEPPLESDHTADPVAVAIMKNDKQRLAGRDRFREVCDTLTYNLMHHTFDGPIFFEVSAFEDRNLRTKIDEINYVVAARQKPLP